MNTINQYREAMSNINKKMKAIDVKMICRLVHLEKCHILEEEFATDGFEPGTYELGNGDFLHYGGNGVCVELSNGIHRTHMLYDKGVKVSVQDLTEAVVSDLKTDKKYSTMFE